MSDTQCTQQLELFEVGRQQATTMGALDHWGGTNMPEVRHVHAPRCVPREPVILSRQGQSKIAHRFIGGNRWQESV